MAININTNLLLANGKSVSADSIKTGMRLMGPDSKPREVIYVLKELKVAYEIRPVKGNSFFCTTDQGLKLKKSTFLESKKDIPKTKYRFAPGFITDSVENIFKKNSSSFYKVFFLYKGQINFFNRSVPINPYFLGLWIGDGHKNKIAITTMDEPIKNEILKIGKEYGVPVRTDQKINNKAKVYTLTRGNCRGYGRSKNPVLKLFQELNLINNKHIPDIYLYNSIEVRLKLLAGIIDTDGYLGKNVYFVTQKSEILSRQIQWLANSVGLRADLKIKKRSIKSRSFTGNYFEISIKGNLEIVPTILDRKKVKKISNRHDRNSIGFKIYKTDTVMPMIEIETSGDNSFILDNGTIIPGFNHPTCTIDSYFALIRESKWEKKLLELESFIKSHNRKPNGNTSNKTEKVLYQWLSNNIRLLRKNKLSHERVNKLRNKKILVLN